MYVGRRKNSWSGERYSTIVSTLQENNTCNRYDTHPNWLHDKDCMGVCNYIIDHANLDKTIYIPH